MLNSSAPASARSSRLSTIPNVIMQSGKVTGVTWGHNSSLVDTQNRPKSADHIKLCFQKSIWARCTISFLISECAPQDRTRNVPYVLSLCAPPALPRCGQMPTFWRWPCRVRAAKVTFELKNRYFCGSVYFWQFLNCFTKILTVSNCQNCL